MPAKMRCDPDLRSHMAVILSGLHLAFLFSKLDAITRIRVSSRKKRQQIGAGYKNVSGRNELVSKRDIF